MPDEIRLYGPYGRPVRKLELTREAGRPTLTGVRQLWRGETVASGLTPAWLATVLRWADSGVPFRGGHTPPLSAAGSCACRRRRRADPLRP